MPKFRKKQSPIDAEPYTPGMEDCWLFNGVAYSPDQMEKTKHELQGFAPAIRTIDGPIAVFPGDMIITSENGERCPVRPEIFDRDYEAVEETVINGEHAANTMIKAQTMEAKEPEISKKPAAPKKPPAPKKPEKPKK